MSSQSLQQRINKLFEEVEKEIIIISQNKQLCDYDKMFKILELRNSISEDWTHLNITISLKLKEMLK